MIHWDWVWTVLIISLGSSTIMGCWTMITDPVKADRMKAEAALMEMKMRYRKEMPK